MGIRGDSVLVPWRPFQWIDAEVVAKRPFMGAEPVLVENRHAQFSGRVRDGLPLGPPGGSSPTKGTAVELRGALNFRGLRVTRALGRLSVRGC